MPSPFPGMDPYLEAHWGDVHTSLTTYARNQLREQLPGDLRARVDEYVHLLTEDDEKQRWAPDVRIVERKTGMTLVRSAPVAQSTTEPAIVRFVTEWTERWIEIRDRAGNELVTSIEFLSHGNKGSPAQRDEFQRKQQQLLQSGANLVEIDLLRTGGWALTVPESEIPPPYSYPYRICVVRADRPSFAECYATPLREPLPCIRIPLRRTDPDVVLELQPLIAAAWNDGDYADIDYQAAPRPQFRPDDELWIQERIAAYLQAGEAHP